MNCRQDFKVKYRNCALFTQLISNLWIQLTKRIFARFNHVDFKIPRVLSYEPMQWYKI